MTLRPLLLGTGIAGAVMALFWLAGPVFFLEGRRPFQLNFAAGAALGLVLGLGLPRLLRLAGAEGVRAVALAAIPGLLVLAAVGSHFAVFFPRLNPSLDKVFGSLMLWFYGFALTGAALAGRTR
ncbi:DUF5367 family protein [Salinarimonas soli]|uniref:Uncharacterized protein n=1 Tax=Salinarimonas soli TaxID=1638099 RepID=A0A5B2VE24_9HYPH|nr:DUF5367 family protein [Salinarimonas soli]KAA2236886.1 hypothetical protein F0L46_12920 [Salinarimonas soli]